MPIEKAFIIMSNAVDEDKFAELLNKHNICFNEIEVPSSAFNSMFDKSLVIKFCKCHDNDVIDLSKTKPNEVT